MVDQAPDNRSYQRPPITSHSCHLYIAGKPKKSVAGYLSVVLGEDAYGAGVDIYWNEPTGGRYANSRSLYSARWGRGPRDTEEALKLTRRALAVALQHLGYAVGETLD